MDWKKYACDKWMVKNYHRNLSLPAKCTTSLNDLKGDSNIASNLQKLTAKWRKRYALEISV